MEYEEWERKRRTGLLTKPHTPCPVCGRKTMARFKCQYCKTKWTSEQLELRNMKRKKIISNYPPETKAILDVWSYNVP